MDQFLYYTMVNIITLFIVINPVASIPFFQGLMASATDSQRNMIANRASLVVAGILLFFAWTGDLVLNFLGITLHYVMIAGGLYILVFTIKQAFSGERSTEPQRHAKEATGLAKGVAERIAIVPISTPLLAGPSAIATTLILNDDPTGVTTTAIGIGVNVILVWLILRMSNRLSRLIKPSVLMVVGTVMNILLAALGVAFVLKGISAAFGLQFL